MCKVNASGQEIGLESHLASLTSTFKHVFVGLNTSFNKSYMRLLSKKQKNIYMNIYLLFPIATRKKIGPRGIRECTGYRLSE